jgi:HEAT repeat protein
MQEELYRSIGNMLASADAEEVERGLETIRAHMHRMTEEEGRRFLDMVVALFYVDPLDRPDLVPALEDAISLVASFGKWAIPVLIQDLETGDVKSQMALAQVLGRMGADAVTPLIDEYYHTCPEGACRAFILYALGKVKSPRVAEAVPVALEAAASDDVELRDSATRALGKFAESTPAGALAVDLRQAVVKQLEVNLADPNPGIRAKAVRSLGKLARYGHLDGDACARLRVTFHHLLGEDEHFEWDRAYVVRKEAKEALAYV